MVYRTKRVIRSTFRNLGFGANYWLTSVGTAVGPRVKYTRNGYIGGWTQSTGAATITAEPDKSAAVIRVPMQFTKRNHAH